MRPLSASTENYLEAIAQLIDENGVAQVSAIAQILGVKLPSVTVALKALAKKGYVNYAPYQPVSLTSEGRAQADSVTRRHRLLRRFLTELLELPAGHADELACRLEHIFDDLALERLSILMDKVRGKPCPAAKPGGGKT